MKNYINKLFIGSALVLSAAMATSCSSDYLNTSATESADQSVVFSSTDNAYKALNGIAKCMTTQQAVPGSGFAGENAIMRLYENLPSQNYNYNAYASGWAPIHNQTFHLRTNSIYDSYAWFYYYQLVGQANSIIANIDKATGSDEDKKFIKASALTFRSYAFEKLTHYYCYRWQDSNNGASQGLVLRLDESTGSQGYVTLAETYAQIYKDLDEAITLYKESGKDRAAAKVWLPNANVAHAVYARAALTKQDYAKALSEAKLAREGYPLMSNTEYQSGFCKNTSEWIFGSYGSEKEQNWYWAYGVQGACNGYYASNAATGAGTIGHELITRIPNNDVRKQQFITADKFPSLNPSDPKQVNQTYGWLSVNDAIWAQTDSIIKAHSVKGLDAAYKSGYFQLDGQLKFWVTAQPGVSYLPFIRSSEMLLIEAEANYFLDASGAAAQANLVELNATSGRNPSYTCTKTGTDLFEEIKDYREVELWGEGFGFSDYKRWNIPIVRHSFKQGGNAHIAVAVTINPADGNKWTWEVPLAETDYNDELKNAAQ